MGRGFTGDPRGLAAVLFPVPEASGRWEHFLHDCLPAYTGNRGSGAKNVMGTVLPGVLSGHWRSAHINGVRGDGVNPGLPGMDGTVSEDAVRSRGASSLIHRISSPFRRSAGPFRCATCMSTRHPRAE